MVQDLHVTTVGHGNRWHWEIFRRNPTNGPFECYASCCHEAGREKRPCRGFTDRASARQWGHLWIGGAVCEFSAN